VVRDLPPYTGIYILSAAHVIANDTFDPLGLPVYQPDRDTAKGEVLGVVVRWGALEFSTRTNPNLFDAAVARVDSSAVRAELETIGQPTGVNEAPRRDDRVKKMGASSGLTHGTIADTDFPCAFLYRDPNGRNWRAGFQRQILCRSIDAREPFSEGGDSGAAVLDESNRVVGLVVGTVRQGTVVCPIEPILQALRVTLP
jgi:hypothetical protein